MKLLVVTKRPMKQIYENERMLFSSQSGVAFLPVGREIFEFKVMDAIAAFEIEEVVRYG